MPNPNELERQETESVLEVNEGNTLDLMMRWEDNDLSHEETVALFQHLVDSGMAWRLQGMYGRAATALIDAGYVTQRG